ncbi:aspartate carbamoyltransferase catalytic subunit [Brevundimonas sp.]|uniref:aspartate carbamoyltransferase catalytic subunit n=1 Tax=Brevundimonas sp. TaxID=1871086 RepID=UPI00289D0F6C|nr:aspartate carbamoyltransferase catalytic subunit [Brevundimonas sp.]
MTQAATVTEIIQERLTPFPKAHFLAAADLNPPAAMALLDLADAFVDFNRQSAKGVEVMRGQTVVNLFFENSTRTSSSFEIAAKRLGADVVTMPVASSSVKKGETLIDTAVTLNAMKPEILVVRHSASGAVDLLSQKVGCAVVNAGDGRHEHPTQALLDLLTLRRTFGDVGGLTVAICGDVTHSRVARSNIALLQMMGANVRLVGPPTLIPSVAQRWNVEIYHDMKEGLQGVDVVMMLRLQLERMAGALIPSTREYFRFWGLDREKLAYAKPNAKVMHPGPMNRGVEIDSDVADDLDVSLIQDQVEMGVAARMAVLAALAHRRAGAE